MFVRMGLSDIWRYKFIFMLCVVYLVLFNTVALVLGYSIYYDAMIPMDTTTSFSVIESQTDLDVNHEQLSQLAWFYKQGAVGTWVATTLSEKYHRYVLLVLGNGTLIDPALESDVDISVFAYDTTLNDFTLMDTSYSVTAVPYTEINGTYEDSVYVLIQNDAIDTFLFLLNQSSPYPFFELLNQTFFLNEDIELQTQYMHFIDQEVPDASIKQRIMPVSLYNDQDFTLYFMVPLTISLACLGMFSFLAIFKGMLVKMRRELTIHLLNGARMKHVFIRFITFFGSMIVLSLILTLNIKVIMNETRVYLVGATLFTFLTVVGVMIIGLRRSNLFDNLRGKTL